MSESQRSNQGEGGSYSPTTADTEGEGGSYSPTTADTEGEGGTFTPTTKDASLNSSSESRAGPPLTIMIGLAAFVGLVLIVVLFIFAGDPYGTQSSINLLQALLV